MPPFGPASTPGSIFHSDIEQLLGVWWVVGENVGVGPGPSEIEAAYEKCPGHYQNLTDPTFAKVGVGAISDGSGRLFTAEVYAA